MKLPLSAPLINTLFLLTDTVLIMALCPEIFLRKVPYGHFHTFILSEAAEQKVYSLGWNAIALTDFL